MTAVPLPSIYVLQNTMSGRAFTNTTLVLWNLGMVQPLFFTDGNVLERYWIEMDCVLLVITKSGFVIMSSEIGVLDIKPEDVIHTDD
jgi:homogentisate 1,2-dioxygenase